MALVSTSQLVFADAERRIITSADRIEGLVAEGQLFEACAAQSMTAEALLSLALFTAVSDRDDLRGVAIRKRMTDSAFGRLIELEATHGILRRPGLSDKLEAYAKRRDFLIDRHLPELQTFDYDDFLALGREILADLVSLYALHAQSLLRKQGLPTEGLF